MRNILVIGLMAWLTGCASLVDGKRQSVSFASNPDGATVSINGRQLGKTPVTVMLDRQSGIQSLSFTKEGYKSKDLPIQAGINSWFWGNVLLGGLYGSTTDALSGAAYEYKPGDFMVTLEPNEIASVPGQTNLPEKQKLVNYLVVSYQQLLGELEVKEGQYTASLYALAATPEDKRQEMTKKIRALSEVYTVIPEFADKVADLLLTK